MRRSKWKNVAERAHRGMRALPASLLIFGALAATPVFAVQASSTDAATKAAMDKRAAARTLLSSALGRIAANGNNAAALLDAGRASMALDDYRSALGFLLRAEQNSPRDGPIKAALGTAMVHQENPQRALDYFGEAMLLKAPERLFVADRGLAYDLLGQQEAAQRDYALALSQQRDDEVTRRYALSLGISGYADRGIEYLAPQLAAQDRSAWRTRAMILAMNGRQDEAKSIIHATLPPALATNIWPYLEQMDRLNPAQLAAAAHFGRFPSGALGPKRKPTQMAAATPVPQSQPAEAARTSPSNMRGTQNASRAGAASAASARRATTVSAPVAARVQPTASAPVAAAPAPSQQTPAGTTARSPVAPPVRPAQVANGVEARPAQRGPSSTMRDMTAAAASANATRSRVQNVVAAQMAVAPAAASAAASAPASAAFPQHPMVGPVDDASGAAAGPKPADDAPLAALASLGEIIGSLQIPANELVRADDAVSADTLASLRTERRRAEQAASAERAAKARAEAEAKAKADVAAKARAEAEAKARAEAARLKANPARLWVQIGTGANLGALAFDWNRNSKKHADLMKGKSGATAEWGRTRRLLVGPFPNRGAAQSFLTEYKKAEGDGFLFNSNAGEEIEPIK